MRALPLFVLGASLLSRAPVLSGCGTSGAGACGPASCQGCCDTAGRCLLGSTQEACGQTGGTCLTCTQQEVCQLGTCLPLQQGTHDGGGGQDAGGTDGGQDGGAEDGGGMLDGGGCSGGLSECAGGCVDTGTHPLHCGGCDLPCATTCIGGTCQPPADCRTGTVVCGPSEYCDAADGACKPGCGQDTDCPQPGACDLGTHACVCAAGHYPCGGGCVADSVQSCGPSCQPCSEAGANGTATCAGGTCGITCDPDFTLVGGACVDQCQAAAADFAPSGCDFWAVVQDSLVSDVFRGGTTSGQGTTDSSFGFLVANPSASPATVQVTRYLNNVVTQVKSVTIAAGSEATVYVPWQSLTGVNTTSNSGSTGSGMARYGYRLQASRPVMVWMFNVLDRVRAQGTCNTNSDCTASFSGVCDASKVCQYQAFTVDSSLLLPAHGLGTSYVVVSNEHTSFSSVFFGAFDSMPGSVTIVATEDGTQVTVTSRAKTRAGTGVPSLAKGQTSTYTLQSYGILQLVTDQITGNDIQCVPNPFNPNDTVCRVDNDLSGSVVTADKPVAVFGGASCALRPFNVAACDHLAEQLPPASTWGHSFVAVRSHPVRVTGGGFASTNAASADLYKVVAVCPAAQCPTGTLVTFSTPPASADVFAPNRCLTGSLATNDCRLPAGAAMEFRSKASFRVTSDFPTSVTHFLAGAGATAQSTQGDPSMILLPPVAQWPESLVVMASPAFSDNYLSLAYDSADTSGVQVNGLAVTGFTPVSGTSYMVKAHPVPGGRVVVQALPKAGSATPPRVGATVYGFAEYVSYGSLAGQRLLPNGTGITP